MVDLSEYNELTGLIIKSAFNVHNVLGNGFQEVIYQRALAIEFKFADIQFEREKEITVFYRDEKIGTRRVDFLIANRVLVELKASTEITDTHYAQIINYLEAFKLEVGLLLNFGTKRLTYKRFVKTVK